MAYIFGMPFSDAQLAHLGLRLVLGINFLGHGLIRMPNLGGFVEKTSAGFATTPLPMALVTPFLWILPFVELAIGLAILAGVKLRATLLGGFAVIAALTFGMCMQQQWETVGLQLVYGLGFFVLLARASDARWQLAA